VEDPIVNSEILHGGEGGDVERWLEPRNKFFMFAIVCLLTFIFFILLTLAFLVLLHLIHYSYLSVFTHLNKKAIGHLNS